MATSPFVYNAFIIDKLSIKSIGMKFLIETLLTVCLSSIMFKPHSLARHT